MSETVRNLTKGGGGRSEMSQGKLNNPHLVTAQFSVRSYIKQATCAIIGTGSKSISIWEELDGIDILLMPHKRLHGPLRSDIPKLRKRIARTGHKRVVTRWTDTDTHNISQVIRKLRYFVSRFDIPHHARHIAR